MFRENDIIFLIGAGCSADAGIPTSKQMIQKLEKLLSSSQDWNTYRDLYHCVKSSIFYADGIKGNFGNNLDIERLVNVLGELAKKQDSPLYPFIGNWNPRLLEIAGHDFGIIESFKKKILERLKSWVRLKDYREAAYYQKFFEFASDYNFSLRVFSLNYDLCFERNEPRDKEIERGFDPTKRSWDWRRFEAREEYQPAIYLYKFHGSIDWERYKEEGNILKEVESIPDEPDLIFGTDYKMQYIDPYLFYAYELRKYSLETQLILVIGYSFGDEHINGILKQALEANRDTKLILVSPHIQKEDIRDKLQHRKDKQIIIVNKRAKEFIDVELRIEKLRELITEASSTK